jgi:hypothetical protein
MRSSQPHPQNNENQCVVRRSLPPYRSVHSMLEEWCVLAAENGAFFFLPLDVGLGEPFVDGSFPSEYSEY